MSRLLLDAGDGAVVLIEGGVIAQLGSGLGAGPGTRRLECIRSQLHVGAVNAHTHLYSGLAPMGMPAPEPEPENFVQILERVWWKLDRALDANSLRASARLYIANALLSGTTTLIDHHESPNLIHGSLDVLADAAQELGVRMIACYGATERNGGREEAQAGLAECRRFLLENDRPLVRGMVGLHASFTVSDETLREAGDLARSVGVPVHVHVAEDAADVLDARRRGYDGVLDRLMRLGALPAGSILAHGVHLSEDEIRRVEEAGCWLVHNPRSNEGNGVGYARSLVASEHVALGTDGYPSDMADQLRALMQLSERHGDRVGAERAHVRAEAGQALAAQRFGLKMASSPATGAAADLIVCESHTLPGHPGPRATHVLVAGELVVDSGDLVRADMAQIRADAEASASLLWQRMRAL